MAKIQKLQERGTGATIYPETIAEAVYFSDGTNAEKKVTELQQSIDDKQDSLEVSEDLSLSDGRLSVTERAKRAVFNDLFRKVFTANINDTRVVRGEYDFDNAPDKSKPYRAYDDEWLSYDDAVESVANAPVAKGIGEHFTSAMQAPCAKVMPPFILPNGVFNMLMNGFARGNVFIEVVYFAQGHPSMGGSRFSNITNAFAFNVRLRKVLYLPLGPGCTTTGAFTQCTNLEEVRAAFVCNLSFADSPRLSLASFNYGVKDGSAGYTITVHPDVYAKLTGDMTNEAAAALSEEEAAQWQQVFTDAAAKNITFATT